jgi:hypothetical protein
VELKRRHFGTGRTATARNGLQPRAERGFTPGVCLGTTLAPSMQLKAEAALPGSV